jgi:large subunit ribosomal protein L29
VRRRHKMAKTAKAETSAEEKKAKKPAAKAAKADAAPKAAKAPRAPKAAKPAKTKKVAAGGSSAGDLHAKDSAALSEEVKALKKEGFNLRFQKASGELRNTARVRVVRREIARLKTVLREKALQTVK